MKVFEVVNVCFVAKFFSNFLGKIGNERCVLVDSRPSILLGLKSRGVSFEESLLFSVWLRIFVLSLVFLCSRVLKQVV